MLLLLCFFSFGKCTTSECLHHLGHPSHSKSTEQHGLCCVISSMFQLLTCEAVHQVTCLPSDCVHIIRVSSFRRTARSSVSLVVVWFFCMVSLFSILYSNAITAVFYNNVVAGVFYNHSFTDALYSYPTVEFAFSTNFCIRIAYNHKFRLLIFQPFTMRTEDILSSPSLLFNLPS